MSAHKQHYRNHAVPQAHGPATDHGMPQASGVRFPGGNVIMAGATPAMPAFTYDDLARYLARYGKAPAPDSPSTEVGRTREAQITGGIEIHVHGDQVPANGGHPSEIHVVSTATGTTEKLAVLGPDQAHARPGEEYGQRYVLFGPWLGRPTHDPADVRTRVLRDNRVDGEISPS